MIEKNPVEHGLQAADRCMSLCTPQSQATLIELSAPKTASNGGFLHVGLAGVRNGIGKMLCALAPEKHAANPLVYRDGGGPLSRRPASTR